MGRGRITVFAVTTAVLITAAVLLAFFYMDRGDETPPISFPDATDSGGPGLPEPGEGEEGELAFVEVTPETVQAVIRTIKRPDSYSRVMTIESWWDGGSVKYEVGAWSKNNETRLTIKADGWSEPKNILITGAYLYIWYGDDAKNYYRAKRDGALADASLYDALQMLPTYEDVLELDPADITEADYVEQPGGWRIRVTAKDGELGYDETYYVSIETGLLEAAEIYDGDRLTYKMMAGEAELSAPDDSFFRLG